MIRTAILAVMTLLALSLNAEARQRHRAIVADPGCNIIFPCEGVAPSARGERIVKAMGGFGSAQKVYKPRQSATESHQGVAEVSMPGSEPGISRPARYIAGRLICAVNVGAALAERGIKGTGSALALSYDKWGHASPPVPGAVAVSNRRGGGHVALVSRVEGSRVWVWNATGGQRGWREIEYTHRNARYRVAG